ncbi:hypothetical protein ON010_g17575 [Phytophthora cinnamomi]|nr:hypothetical protein ON010_g17575 [Phytophthora cinnamomi]
MVGTEAEPASRVPGTRGTCTSSWRGGFPAEGLRRSLGTAAADKTRSAADRRTRASRGGCTVRRAPSCWWRHAPVGRERQRLTAPAAEMSVTQREPEALLEEEHRK